MKIKSYIPKLIILLFFTSFFACKNYENAYYDKCFKLKSLYTEDLSCDVFPYMPYYKHYSSKKCFSIKYHFSKEEYKDVVRLVKSFAGENRYGKPSLPRRMIRREYKRGNSFLVSPVKINNKELINDEAYGFYNYNANFVTSSFYFLRTEKGIIFYKCKDKDKLIKQLYSSQKIDISLKKAIEKDINKKCEKGEGLKYFVHHGVYWRPC